MIDSKASLEAHVTSVCRSSYINIHNISKIRRYLDRPSMECIVHSFITTKLDYCNSLLCGAPAKLLNKLQRVQNVAARILTGTKRCEHITPVLHTLHWLPIEQRIKYKVLMLVYKAAHQEAPQYLNELISYHTSGRQLRSADQKLLHVPFTRSSLVQSCAFDIAGPILWNSLPPDIRNSPNLNIFKSKLKTFLFTQFYIDFN